jgi:hypothetical protein
MNNLLKLKFLIFLVLFTGNFIFFACAHKDKSESSWKRANPEDKDNPWMRVPEFKKAAEEGRLYTSKFEISDNRKTSNVNDPANPIQVKELVGTWAQSSGVPLFASINQPVEGLIFEDDGEVTVSIGKILFTRGKYSIIPGNRLRVDGFPGGTQFGSTANFDISLSGDNLTLKRETAQATYRKVSKSK